ncbi:methyl-accepting chemotaxis protein [Psychrosphaera ytuae]|uniref:Methyl-accepting chemotaxis protein n=1 Tax=Psychrosphaera ytuae TaxID=2820710 RepID=A0A975DE64_9GAMM|nr:methyl-accepting chemotaxis protein [Psychrosphaera ytuae]QTH64721.1 methyl-accepting chemotaxis protein [Psychrosphaera ytuae]
MFKTFFRPATLLMNKLRFGYKFTLIVLLFFVPLIILAINYVSLVKKEIVHSENELEAVAYIKKVDAKQFELVQLIIDDMHWRSGQTIPPNQTRAIDNYIESLNTLIVPELLGEQATKQFKAQLEELKTVIKEKTSTVGSAQWRSPTDKMQHLSAIIEEFNNTYPLLANIKGLTNDPDIDTVLLSRLLIEKRLPTLNVLLRGYGLSMYAVGEPQVSSGTFDSLSFISDDLAAELNTIQELNNVVRGQDKRLTTLVSADVENLTLLVDNALMYIEEQFLIADDIVLTQAQLTEHVNNELNAFYAGKAALFDEFETRLEQRVFVNTRNFYILIALVSVSLLLVIYLFVGMSLSISITTKSLTRVARSLADGDTTVSAKTLTKDELAEAIDAFNQMAINVHNLVQAVQSASQGVTNQAQAVEELSHQTGQAVASQLGDTEAITHAIEELLEAVSVVSENTSIVVNSLNSATEQTEKGRETLADARQATDELGREIKHSVEVIHQLSQQSDSINQVLDVIKGIAEQTNLLALNAAIEAARAGEQGRGFAVVADEVRGLAKRTHDSTSEIQSTILTLQDGVQKAVQAMTRSDQQATRTIEESAKLEEALDHISASVAQINEQNTATEQATQRQQGLASKIEQSLTSISEVSGVTDQNVKDSIEATNRLGKFVTKLESMLEKFKT